ncbi:hypothetical protein NIES2101_29075 [Calothrix sp. HK-06]|nr:hypothetical protein NIES2101_29075 [Calothrix sp. HK-06]
MNRAAIAEVVTNTDSTQNEDNVECAISTVQVNELTYDEQRERERLERLVERAFYQAGLALKELRDKRLYRSTHASFDEYCKDRFAYHRSRYYQLINAATIVDNLQPCLQFVDILPTAEGQVRPLVPLDPDEQRLAWTQAVKATDGKVPSARVVKDIVDKIRSRTKLPNPYRVGEVCLILPKDNPDLRGKSGCWCIVTHVGDFSCTIETWDNKYIVKIEHLKSLSYTDSDCEFMGKLLKRLRRLYQLPNHDSSIDWQLVGLGKRSEAWLTDVQQEVLHTLEKAYGLIET